MKPSSAAAIAACFLAVASASPATPASAPEHPAQAHAAKKAVLPFLEDDYAGALARAKARGLPIFVEAWAPW